MPEPDDDLFPAEWENDEDDLDSDDLLQCPSCRQSVHEDTQQCPYCGEWIIPIYPRRFNRRLFVVVVIALFLLFLLFLRVFKHIFR